MRKVIQIAASGAGPDTNSSLLALCDDGTMWEYTEACKWAQISEVPQDSDEKCSHHEGSFAE